MYYPDTAISSSETLEKYYMVLLILKAELIIEIDIFIIQRGKIQRKKLSHCQKIRTQNHYSHICHTCQ